MTSAVEVNGAFDLSELISTPSIVQDQTQFKLWGNNEKTEQFLGVINSLERDGFMETLKSKIVKWPIGEHPLDTATLSSTFTVAGTYPNFTGSDSTITLTEARFFNSSTLYLYDSASTGFYAIVRLNQTSGSSAGALSCEVIDGTARVFATATTTVVIGSTAHNYERITDLDYINFKGTLLSNSMTASRSQVGVGRYERTASFLADNSLEHKVGLHWIDFQKKMCTSLLVNRTHENAETGSRATDDFGMSIGIPGILLDGLSDGTTTYKGTNVCSSNTNINEEEIRAYLAGDLTAKGSNTRLVYGSPEMINKFFTEFGVNVDLMQKEPVYNIMPEYQDVWMLPTFEVGFCKLQFVTDRQIGKIYQKGSTLFNITAGTGTLSASTKNYLIFLDPTMIGMTYMDVEGEGVKTPQIREVKGNGEGNQTIDKKEIEAVWSFWIKEPSTCGYFFLGGS